ncbi:hypothetical protein N7481_012582 [Penicillium waksmanii]|uniref:uncharacterized protein n=1 Tax=Penicillium waksmanii TaxID=69791 RepID=UPI0025467DFA|nr:uncharacterized protein N7481_012582 [Penicillium waksmanii]KAJ5965868.1 hypothetical protein N7481_012582 [Penicillium waksmanii]
MGQISIVGTADLDPLDFLNRTPLFYAAMYGHKDAVEVLLSNSSPSIRDHYGATPLCVAVRKGHVDVVRQLVTFCKEKSDFEDGLGPDLLWWAAGSGQDGMIDIIRQFAQEIGIEAPEPNVYKECVVTKSTDNHIDHLFDICARSIPSDFSSMRCETCEGFDVCLQCVGFKVECLDFSHTWKLQEPDAGDSDRAEDSDDDIELNTN